MNDASITELMDYSLELPTKWDQIKTTLTQLGMNNLGTNIGMYTTLAGHDIHVFYQLRVDPQKLIHVQTYPRMSTCTHYRAWARMMSLDILTQHEGRRLEDFGNAHDAVVQHFPNFEHGVMVPYDYTVLESMLKENIAEWQ